jgi:antitoxin component of MazEF toxin-antitoxin module
MPTLLQRTLIKFGDGGLVMCLPKAWTSFYGLKAGDKVEVITNGELRIRPKPRTQRELK